MDRKLITALATPFKNEKFDVKSYAKLIRFQIENGVDALLALGTTAESQLLTECERKLAVNIAKGLAEGTPIIVGIHESATDKAVREAKKMQDLGADALLIAPPVFCKCTAVGYRWHIESICEVVDIPVILYNVPSRAGYCLNADAVISLTGKMAAVKDACGNTEFASKVINYAPILCGNDEKLTDYIQAGCCGVISVTSNVAPQWTREILTGKKSAEFEEFARLTMQEVNPIAIKYLLCKAEIFDDYDVRLPLTKANETTRKSIEEFWQSHKDLIR